MSQTDCLFCKIAAGDIPADVVHRDDRVVAFRDINPQAPTHVLVIPTEHVASLDAAAPEHQELLGELLLAAQAVARTEGLSDAGYRVVTNVGPHGGQTVHHLHIHVLGGRPMGWPPG